MTKPSSSVPQQISILRVLLLLLLILGAFILLRNISGTKPTPILQPLANFPTKMGAWSLQAAHVSMPAVVEMLGVDDYIEYTYADAQHPPINFYVAFYESVGTGGGYHSPKNCIPGGGWGIDRVKELEITPTGSDNTVTVEEMIIRRGSDYQLVVYWYQNRGRVISSEYWEKIYQVLDAITLQRRDGSFVRLIIDAPDGNIEAAEETLRSFAAQAMTELDQFLPGR